MISYDVKSWMNMVFISKFIRSYKHSYNLKQLLKILIIVGIYTSIITTIHEIYLYPFTIDSFYFSLMGLVLSLFLVFRLNSAYDKWWEGRKLWGKLVNDSRTLAANLNSLIFQEDHERRKFFVVHISNFSLSLVEHLRDMPIIEKLVILNDSTTKILKRVKHIPNQIASFLFEEMESMFRKGIITEADKINLKVQIQGLVDVLGACERIKNTPIPFSHSTYIKNFITLYIIALPFGLVDAFHYLTVPAVLLMTYALVGIEIISDEIEMPFGLEANDLPTGKISKMIAQNVYEILHVQSDIEGEEIYKDINIEIIH